MIRAAFLSMGLYLVMCGAGLFYIDQIVLNDKAQQLQSPVLDYLVSRNSSGGLQINPPEWLPFTAIGVGGVTMLYSIALPKSAHGGGRR